jgi:hypothetical protein
VRGEASEYAGEERGRGDTERPVLDDSPQGPNTGHSREREVCAPPLLSTSLAVCNIYWPDGRHRRLLDRQALVLLEQPAQPTDRVPGAALRILLGNEIG